MDVKLPKSLDELSNLLRLYKGVEVGECHMANAQLFLCLRISEPESIVRLEFFSRAANIQSSVYAESLPLEIDSNGEALRRLVWQFVFAEDKNNPDLPQELKAFGVFLVWDLDKRGILNESESARLLRMWEGSRRKQ